MLLGLHGGPGASHDYLAPFFDLAVEGYRVVLFDQLGCGRSELPEDPACFTLEHNVTEVEAVREALGLGSVHLIGSSYGGMLALAYAIRHGEQLRSLITVGGLADVPFAQAEMRRLIGRLPAGPRELLRRGEDSGRFDEPNYLAAVDLFYHRHLCRLARWPAELIRSLEYSARRPVYRIMNGPNEFTINGRIREIDLTPGLPSIAVPTLVLGGRFDEVTPRVAAQIARSIPGARRFTFARSSHLPFWEERARFRSVAGAFLREVGAPRPE